MRAAVADLLFELAVADERIVFVGSDLGAGAMEQMRRRLPARFFMEGISEQYIIGMAAGLAMDGLLPYVSSIATFITRRCYEQIALDVCLQNLPVRMLGNGSGLAYGPLGPTHLALDDLAILRACPNLALLAPGDRWEARELLRQTVSYPGPVYLRLGPTAPPDLPPRDQPVIGTPVILRAGGDVALVSLGTMTVVALAAADLLAERGIGARLVHVHSLAPLDHAALLSAISGVPLACTVEEHSVTGGLGSCVAELLASSRQSGRLRRIGLPAGVLAGASPRPDTLVRHGLDPAAIAEAVRAELAAMT